MKRFILILPDDLYDAVRAKAAERGQRKIADWVRQAIREKLDRES